MSFIVLLAYLVLTYIRPYELYPALAKFRLMLVFGALGGVLSFAYLPMSRFTGRATQFWLVLAFSAIVITSPIVALHWLGGALPVLEEFGITATIFFVAAININSLRRVRIVTILLSLLSIVLVVQVVLAFRFGYFADVFILEQAALDGVRLRARATGFMTDPNDLGQSLVMAIPFLWLSWRAHSHLRNLILVLVPAGILCYGIYLTGSRGTLLSLIAVIVTAWRMRLTASIGGKAVTACAILGGLILMLTGGRLFGVQDASAMRRIEAWSLGLQLFKQNPLFGVGYKQFWNYNEVIAHNAFVTCFSELGIVGFFVWMATLVVTYVELNALRKLPGNDPLDRDLRRYALAIQISLNGFLAAAWFLSRTYVVTLYILIALAIALAEVARRAKKPLPSLPLPALTGRTGVWCAATMVLLYVSIKLTIR